MFFLEEGYVGVALLPTLLAKSLNSFVCKVSYSTYLLLTSVSFILVECLASVKLERGDVKICTLLLSSIF